MRPNERLDLTSMISSERINLIGDVTISFFNELDTGKRTMLKAPSSIPKFLFHFFNELATERKTMLMIAV
jgi:hypothetical protein